MRLVYSIHRAKYAKGRYIVRCPSRDGYKTRAARLAAAFKGRYTHREHGYSLSLNAVTRFRACYRNGCDATIFGHIEHTEVAVSP